MLNQKIMSLRKHIQASLALWFHVWLQLDRHALFHRLCCPKRHNLRSGGGISPSGTASPWPPIGKGFKAILCVKPGAYCWECRGEEQVLELDFQFHGSQNTQGFFFVKLRVLREFFCSLSMPTWPCSFRAISFSDFVLQTSSVAHSKSSLLHISAALKEETTPWSACWEHCFLRLTTQSNQSQKLRHFIVMAISMPNFSPQASATQAAELFKRRQEKVFMEGKNSFLLSSYSHMDEMFLLKLSKKFTFEQRPRALFEQF